MSFSTFLCLWQQVLEAVRFCCSYTQPYSFCQHVLYDAVYLYLVLVFQQNMPEIFVVLVGRNEKVFKVRHLRSRSLWHHLCKLCECGHNLLVTRGILIRLATNIHRASGKNWEGFSRSQIKVQDRQNSVYEMFVNALSCVLVEGFQWKNSNIHYARE